MKLDKSKLVIMLTREGSKHRLDIYRNANYNQDDCLIVRWLSRAEALTYNQLLDIYRQSAAAVGLSEEERIERFTEALARCKKKSWTRRVPWSKHVLAQLQRKKL